MELTNIEKLIEKYVNASTTLQEEQILKNYFNSKEVAPHLKEYGTMFEYFKLSKEEILKKPIQLKTKKNWKWLSIAASVTILISIFIGKKQYYQYQQRKQFSQIKEALQLLSLNLNKGNDALFAISNNLTKGSDAVSKLNLYQETANSVIEKVNY